MTLLTPSELLDLHTLLLGSGSARAYRTGSHRTAVKRLFDHATASQARAFSELTEDALEKMVEASLLKPGGPVVLLTLLHHLQVFATPSWEPLSHGAEYPETFLLCRKDGSSGAVPGGYDKLNPHFYVFDSDGSSWIKNINDWLWMPPPAVPNGPKGGAA